MKNWYKTDITMGAKATGLLNERYNKEIQDWELVYTLALAGKPQHFIKDYSSHNIPRFISFSVHPIIMNEKVTGLSCYAQDITRQKLAEDKLKATEQRYRLVSQSPIMGITWVSAEGKVLLSNKAFCKMLGYTNLEMLDMHYSKFTHPDDLAAQTPILEQLASGEIDSYRGEKRYISKTGEVIWGELILSTARDKHGDMKYFIGLVQNINGRKKAEEELSALNESLEHKIKQRTTELQEINEELENFSSMVSHDLKAPLRAINGYSKILLNEFAGKMDREASSLLAAINSISAQGAKLVKSLLDFSKLGNTGLEKKEVNMQYMVEKVAAEISSANKEFPTRIVIDDLGHDFCDSALITQVWANLIDNAVKYSSKTEKPVINIGIKEVNGDYAYYVQDNGTGFNMEDAHKLFKPFQRIHSGEEFEGSGIGLATVYRIINKHGGKIWAESEANKGATFYFTLSQSKVG